MKIIGILGSARLFENDDPYGDQYLFINAYVKRIAKNGGIPLGVLGEDGHIPPGVLELCDAFLICGGRKMWPYHIEAVEYAHHAGKKVLGICLGMQAIAAYFRIRDEMESRNFSGGAAELFEIMKRENYMFTLPVAHHWDCQPTRTDADKAKHAVEILPGSRLYTLLGKQAIRAATMHNYRINGAPDSLTVSARTADGTIEGLEYKSQMLGVQFHPEIDDELDALFKDLTD